MLKASENLSNWSNLLEVATTWICLLVHWPFHSAWLSLFLEEHYLSGGAGQTMRQRIRIPGIIGSDGDSSDDDDDDDDENTASTASQPVLPEDTLPMLYSRVLERLAPALSACRSRGGALSSQIQSPASHRSHSSSGGWQNTAGGLQTGAALRLSELASRDCGPDRLASLLRYRPRARAPSLTANAARPSISVRHLVAVMASSPLMNPKTRARIQAFLNRRGFSLIRSSSRDLHVHRSLQSLRDRDLELLPISINPPKTVRPCPVRLKNGVPRKPLSKMTVNDVCRLVDDMIDLYSNHCPHRTRTNSESTSDTPTENNRHQTTPQFISRSTSIAAYFLRLRALNISGAVLTVCSLNESLRREIGMTFGDWQLFTKLINHLKMLENENIPNPPTPQHNCQCARSMGDLASIHHTHWHHTHPNQHGSSKPNHNTWTSESILGAATKWRHGNDSSPSPINNGSSASSSIVSGSCMSADPNWRGHGLSNQEETCHLSGGSCSVYSAELSCSISSSEDTIPSNASSPSLSSLHSSTLQDETLSQDKISNKHWRYDVNV
ncbi:unnamed protein product [Rodentolepis nana]|uniref:Protein kinase domain-containing protein n=1 Tax=Rodentolepis nana TaxID=102285 RepID=A0A158QIZ4_RODNA|nr:unnamed protein product [Rodentolepis nana]